MVGLSPGYKSLSLFIKEVNDSLVISCRRTACSRKLSTDEKYNNVALCLCFFLTQNVYRTKIYMLKQDVFEHFYCFYGTAALVIKNRFSSGMADIRERRFISMVDQSCCCHSYNTVLTFRNKVTQSRKALWPLVTAIEGKKRFESAGLI